MMRRITASTWLAGVGLVEPRPAKTSTDPATGKTVASLIASFSAAKLKAKGSTRTAWGHYQRNLIEFFGEAKDIATITEADTERWCDWITVHEKLGPATVYKSAATQRHGSSWQSRVGS
jgi:hypothetical protein